VVAAMQIYKETEVDLQDCEATMQVTRKIGALITAMTARSSQNALLEGNESNKVGI